MKITITRDGKSDVPVLTYQSEHMSFISVTLPQGHACIVLDGEHQDDVMQALQAILMTRWSNTAQSRGQNELNASYSQYLHDEIQRGIAVQRKG